ncbi:hypothetical protein JST97_04290 [bacterium]|nr:hypothetical protein [bacterium]
MNDQDLVRAGGIAPLATEHQPAWDKVMARRYLHPALGERPVVRLVAESLGEAEDLTLEFHGFQPPVELSVVGWQQRRALGFPGWALVHDPERAAFALEVVKEFRAQARLAKSRPGAAKEGLDQIAARLGRSVPHFLPSFYEECGRALIGLENANLAAQFFNKAREAEKVHALQVDEDLRRESFLEFALAGAVSVKAISEYAGELTRTHRPEQAYHHFHELCLRRTLGGLPPWASMLKELARLAKAAGRDPGHEEREFLLQILDSASVARGPIEFWSSASATIKGLCSQSVPLADRLLAIRPEFGGDRIKAGESWFKLLQDWGVLERLYQDAQVAGGAAGWLQSMIGQFYTWRNSNPNPDQLFQVVRRLAPRLRREARPVQLASAWRKLDLDLFELLAELDVPIDWTELAKVRAPIQSWEGGQGPERLKDPQALAQIEQLWPFFRGGLDQCLGRHPFESHCKGKPGWQALRRRWFEEAVARLENGGLPGLRATLERWERASDPGLLTPFPELQARLSKLSLADLLARSVSTLVIQELSWPAAEQAMRELSPDAQDKLQFYGLYPNLVVVGGGRAIAVSPDQIEARHDLVMPAGSRLHGIAYLEGRFLVNYYLKNSVSYWSDRPDETFELEGYFQNFKGNETLICAEGGVSVGHRAVRAGDKSLPQVHKVFGDGQSCWRLEWTDLRHRLREFDPRTGQAGRFSMPAFLEDYVEPEAPLELACCSLFPLPAGQRECLLGQSGGLTGWRMRRRADGKLEAQTIDGREWLGNWEGATSGMPGGLLQLPGGQAMLAGRYEYWQVYHPEQHFLAASPADGLASLVWHLPRHWWTLLRLRDAQASRSLRVFDRQRAAGLLANPGRPDIQEPTLALALTGLAEHAKACKKRLDVFLKAVPAQGPDAPRRIYDKQVEQLTRSLGLNSSNDRDYTSEVEFFQELCQTSAASAPTGLLSKLTGLFTGKSPAAPPALEVSPRPLGLIGECAGRLGGLAWRSVAPFTDLEQSQAAWELLRQWSESPLLQRAAHFRRMHFKERLGFRPSLVRVGQSIFAVDSDYMGCRAIEYSQDGVFRLPEGVHEESSDPCGQAVWDSPERIKSFLQEARQRGPRPWDPQHPMKLSERTGLSVAEATLLLAGMPFVYNYESNFLPPAMREALGLKAADARAARETFRNLSARQRLGIYNLAMPLEARLLWEDPDGCLERLGQAWNRIMGQRLAVDEERLHSLDQLGAPRKPAEVLTFLSQAESGPLGKDGRFSIKDLSLDFEEGSFDGDWLRSLVLYSAYLNEAAPIGDGLRQSVASAWRLVQARLANPHLLLRAGAHYLETPEKKANLFQAFGLKEVQDVADLGATVVADRTYSISLFFRPARPLDTALQVWAGVSGAEQLQAFLVSQQPGFKALIQRLENSPLPAGCYEANPLLSAPELVAEVQAKFALSQPAATLYLQTLALARPTSKNIQIWNDWKAPLYKQASEELCRAGLLLEARRARAGRSHFLPGGWENRRAPDLPLESFKLPLYNQVLGRVLALEPLHCLFARAWSLVLEGKGPAYEEVR